MPFSGAVLTGGRSSRMGRDKAFVEIDGQPMVMLARRALIAAGATGVVAVGGDAPGLAALGLETIPDTAPGEGPLGGIIDALEHSDDDVVVVLACDHPNINDRPRAPAGADASPIMTPPSRSSTASRSRSRPPHARRSRSRLRTAFDGGERSPRAALEELDWCAIEDVDPSWVRDVDEPRDVARYAAERQPPPTDPR